MPGNARKFVRVTKLLLAGVTIFCVSWIACINEWHTRIRWNGKQGDSARRFSTMRTIVAYSEEKQAELDRPSPVTCDRLPAFPELPHINRTWMPGIAQEPDWQRVEGTQVSLYAAYYDNRTPQKYVRILASYHGRNFSASGILYCQTRSQNSYEESLEVVTAKPLEIWWHEWDTLSAEIDSPLLLSCPLTESLFNTAIVSIVTEPCENPTNSFIINPVKRNRYKRKFTICVKDMNFNEDISQYLIEWIETNKILGADIIDIYVDNVSKDIEAVLSYYRDKNQLRLFNVPTKYKPDRTFWQRRRDHIITYNDCLYRNMEESEFIIPIDIDEIVLPKIATTWSELISRLTNLGWSPIEHSSIMIRNVFFFEFMQKRVTLQPEDLTVHENITYVKRDDVRIDNDARFNNNEIKSPVFNLSNEVIDVKIHNKFNDKYKTTCGIEFPKPKLLSHFISSAKISPIGHYSKSFMLTKRVLTAFNHYPLASLGAIGISGWSAPFNEVQLNHYKKSCNTTMVSECEQYNKRTRLDRGAQRLESQLLSALANVICSGIKII
ncbi:hypothetical protein K1T71_007782 [Dendrolimus kikuchii]|uniref:Uncharacterized protein n=1 Tax=Dendrolimus kikuchii TaxID=765133 RepID=A0ACC1CY76_9NEOP|nr:hypothetical protein K1T71_007782 [Dendrolimus kikuchii]